MPRRESLSTAGFKMSNGVCTYLPEMLSLGYSTRLLRKLTSFSIALAPFHPSASFSFPRGRRTTTHMHTFMTGFGGVINAFISVISFLSRFSRALAAASNAGIAAANASSALAFSWLIVTWSCATLQFPICCSYVLHKRKQSFHGKLQNLQYLREVCFDLC